MRALVSLAACSDYGYSTVVTAIEQALTPLGGLGVYVHRGDRVLLKPNLLYGRHPDKAVTTHPAVVKAIAELVLAEGGIPVIGDSPGMGTFPRAADAAGLAAIARELDCNLISFDDAVTVNVGQDYTFRQFDVARAALETDVIINLPKVKTHGMMLLTLAVKNMFGCVPGMRKAQWHLKAGINHDYFATMLVELCQLMAPSLSIADGVVAMEGNGPGSGDPRRVGVIVAGAHVHAVDAAICRVLGVAPELVPTLRVARQRGVHGAAWNDIEVAGPPLEQVAVSEFRLPRRVDVQWRLPGLVKKPLRNMMLPKPVVNPARCHACGTCREVCPPHAISCEGGTIRIDYGRCIRCFCCQEMCPEGAISVKDTLLSRIVS